MAREHENNDRSSCLTVLYLALVYVFIWRNILAFYFEKYKYKVHLYSDAERNINFLSRTGARILWYPLHVAVRS